MSEKRDILIVDDNLNSLDAMQEIIQSAGYNTILARHGQEALDLLSTIKPMLIVSDLRMPRVNGIELLRVVRDRYPDAGVVLLTGHGDIETAIEALKLGADDFLLKPINIDELLIAIDRALERRQLLLERRQYQRVLEQRGPEAMVNGTSLDGESQDGVHGLLSALGSALDRRAGRTDHTRRATRYAALIAKEYGLPAPAIDEMTRGGLLREIGTLAVPDALVSKSGPLTPEEQAMMRQCPRIATELLTGIPFLAGALPVIAHLHERWDGTGYPDGLEGEAIPLTARIFAVADAFALMTPDGGRASARSLTQARTDIQRLAGTRFDPAVVDAFRRVPESAFDGICHPTNVGPVAERTTDS
jgi:response regulator RpfG family c-di-GMP phosphodiesterase